MFTEHDEISFASELQAFFTPAQPISKPEHLHGRTTKLQNIRRSLNSPGKHVFIYGDRGVGKTSLAKTAAQLHLCLGDDLPIVACQANTNFPELVESLCREVVRMNNHFRLIDQPSNIREAPHLQSIIPLTVKNINDAIEAISRVIDTSVIPTPIVILDEFDQLSSDVERKNVADLIKQLSDRGLALRLIICGIGSSLEELIGVHLSTDRYLSTIELEKIPHDARWQIITAAVEHFRVKIDQDSIIRIGQISDGYPYYVHLIGEKIFWELFDDSEKVDSVTSGHYDRGIKAAIEEAQTSLKQAYDLATQKHSNSEDYEEVLWAVSDGHLLQRQVSDIFEQSYKAIMNQREGRPSLSKDQFYQRMNKLKQGSHGCVLNGSKQGWYSFRENVLRGYVRLRAEQAGIAVGIDHSVYGRPARPGTDSQFGARAR